ncbi:NACHT domain-containing protein [Agromyces mangrovi Wang et al. 2018]|uniref:NACHT domain-containing protein n=1 Tax=Agromyces mangrovi TaxID=1858653 RepID=UPI003306901A
MKRLHRGVCHMGLARRGNKSPLSVAIELKNCKVPPNPSSDWLLSQVRSVVAGTHGFDMHTLFDVYANSEGVVVLLDGLDEVASTNYTAVRDGIRGLSDELVRMGANNQVVLTMRSGFFHQVRSDFDETFPTTLRVKPLSPAEVYTFLGRWPFDRDAERRANHIYKELTETPALRDLCANPLILAMYVARTGRP